MCHSVDMYLPGASRRAAEARILEARAAAAAREQRVVDAVFRLAAWLRRRIGPRPAEASMREMVEHG